MTYTSLVKVLVTTLLDPENYIVQVAISFIHELQTDINVLLNSKGKGGGASKGKER